jgi:two-component system response regulator VicR
LELGAEDYIAKPFHLKELMLRIQNSLKRAQILTQGEWVGPQKIGEAKITFDRFEIERDGKVESLTHKECALLRFLFERNHRVASREDILAHVWLGEESPSTRTVDNFILRLRRWIEKDPENPMIIKTVRGVGYQMNSGDSK